MTFILLLSGFLLIVDSINGEEASCYADNANPYLYFATKTAYEHAYNKKRIVNVPVCKPIQLWLVSRHGTRWPDFKEFEDFKELFQIRDHIVSNYNSNKGSLCQKDIENLKEWRFEATPDQSDMLTKQGREDLYQLGQRVRSYFPELFEGNPTTYSPDKFVFRHTDTARTKESSEYFARGVLGLQIDDAAPTLPQAIKDDPLIYPYSNCSAWSAKIEESKKERTKFYKGVFMKKVIQGVSKRLGFDYNLTLDNVKNIYDGCRFQKAWTVSGISPWCAAFTEKDLEILEYSEDIKYFYKSGPGTEMNLRLGCPLAKDLYDRFSQVENSPESQHPVGAFYFSHATMVDMITARLGLYRESMPLTADNYPQQQYRDFRTSKIIPFTGNVLAVLYQCTKGEPLQTIFYQAENIVHYEGCSVGLCSWNYIKQRLEPFVKDSSCTDDKFCFDLSSAVTHSTSSTLLLTLCLLLRSHSQ